MVTDGARERIRHPAEASQVAPASRQEAYQGLVVRQLEEGLVRHNPHDKTVAAVANDLRVVYPLPKLEAKLVSNLLPSTTPGPPISSYTHMVLDHN